MIMIYNGKKEASTDLKKPQRVGLHIEMITVNRWSAGGTGGGVSVLSMGEMRKDFCPNFRQH